MLWTNPILCFNHNDNCVFRLIRYKRNMCSMEGTIGSPCCVSRILGLLREIRKHWIMTIQIDQLSKNICVQWERRLSLLAVIVGFSVKLEKS